MPQTITITSFPLYVINPAGTLDCRSTARVIDPAPRA